MHLTEAGEEERRHFLTGVGKLYNGFKDKARPVNSFGFKRRYKLLSKLRRGYVLPSISWSVAAVTASCLFVSRYHQWVKVPLSPPHRRHHSIFILFVWIESIFRKTPWCTLFQCSTEWCFLIWTLNRMTPVLWKRSSARSFHPRSWKKPAAEESLVKKSCLSPRQMGSTLVSNIWMCWRCVQQVAGQEMRGDLGVLLLLLCSRLGFCSAVQIIGR